MDEESRFRAYVICTNCEACSRVYAGVKEDVIPLLCETWNMRALLPEIIDIHGAAVRGRPGQSVEKVMAAFDLLTHD